MTKRSGLLLSAPDFMKRASKSWMPRSLADAAVRTVTALRSVRARRHSHGLVREWGLHTINRRLVNEVGSRVLSGPFRGLQLTPAAFREHAGPFLLGTYEEELHRCWNMLIAQPFDLIVNVGAQFG